MSSIVVTNWKLDVSFFNRGWKHVKVKVKVKVDLEQNPKLIKVDLLRVWKEVKVVYVMNWKEFGTEYAHVRYKVSCDTRCHVVRGKVRGAV